MGDSFGGYTASALRSVLVLLILVPIAIRLGGFEPVVIRKNWKYVLGMIFGSFFIWGPLYYSILHAGVGLALTINYACIVIGMFLFGWLLAGEKLTKRKAAAACVGFLGLVVIFSPADARLAWLALGAASLSGLATAFDAVLSKKIPYNTTQTTIVIWITSVIANTIMALFIREPFPADLGMKWLYLLCFAIVSVIASWALTRGVKLIDAGIAGILGLLEIVFALMIGVIFFHEKPGFAGIAGALIIILASAIPYLNNQHGD
jgi:drug/metabolite transporter (DMT)-like permease